MKPNSRLRVLAIASGYKHVGYAVFEESELVRFGVKTQSANERRSEFIKDGSFLDSLVQTYRPRVFAVYTTARISSIFHWRAEVFRRWTLRHHVRTVCYPSMFVRQRVCGGKYTASMLADSIATRFDFLRPLLSKGEMKTYWQRVFAAIALGIVTSEDARQSHLSAWAGTPEAAIH